MQRIVTVILLVCVTIALSLLFAVTPLLADPSENDVKVQVVQKFLRAYFLKSDNIIPYVPYKAENLFSLYPFKGTVQYFTPKIHGNQGVLEFKATVIDSSLPQKGGILFYNHENQWHIRQVLFYDTVPAFFGLPDKSVTASDRKSEPVLSVIGERFMQDWAKGDVDNMLVHWFDWPKSPGDPIKGLYMGKMKITYHPTSWGDPYVNYAVKFTYRWGILSYSMTLHGGLIMVDEDGVWKVRGNEMIFKW